MAVSRVLPETAPGVPALPLRMLSDERLAALAAQGGDRAFTVLYERHLAALERYCRGILRDDGHVEDVVQATMERAFFALDTRDGSAALRPWLFRIAHNEAVNVLRRRRPTADLRLAEGVAGPPLERCLEVRERLGELLEDLQDLPERQRSALMMRELGGLSHEEIAAALAMSVGAAKQAVYEARVALFDFAAGREMTCDRVRRAVSHGDGRRLRSRPHRAHLRACQACGDFRRSVRDRRRDVAAAFSPLPAIGLLARLGTRASEAAEPLSTMAKAAGAPFALKAGASALVATTAVVGMTRALPPRPEPAAPSVPAATSSAAKRGASPPIAVLLAPRMDTWPLRLGSLRAGDAARADGLRTDPVLRSESPWAVAARPSATSPTSPKLPGQDASPGPSTRPGAPGSGPTSAPDRSAGTPGRSGSAPGELPPEG